MSRRTVTRPEVRVGGFWLSSIVPRGWGELRHSTRKGGSWEASWSIPIVRGWRHPALVYGARVEIYMGPICLWSGTLDEPDWDGGEFIASGSSRDGEDAVAIDGSGNASTAPNTVIDAAIARGVLSWVRVGNFGTTPVGDDDGALVTVSSVLDAWAQVNGSRWYVTPERNLVIEPLPTTPGLYVVPGSGALGSAAQDRADRVFVRYINSTTGARATASHPAATPASGIERPLDVTDRGPMTSAAAQDIAESTWASLAGGSGWTNGLTLGRGQVTTPGGPDVDLAFVKAGDMMRLLDQPDPNGLAHHLDVTVGDTDYDWTDDRLQANPVGLAARDQESVLERVGEIATAAYERASRPSTGGTNWINLSSALTSGTARYKVDGGMVTIQVDGAMSTATGVSTVVVTAANSVPPDLRPVGAIVRNGGYFGGHPGTVSVSTTGEVTALHQSGATRGSVSSTITYPIG